MVYFWRRERGKGKWEYGERKRRKTSRRRRERKAWWRALPLPSFLPVISLPEYHVPDIKTSPPCPLFLLIFLPLSHSSSLPPTIPFHLFSFSPPLCHSLVLFSQIPSLSPFFNFLTFHSIIPSLFSLLHTPHTFDSSFPLTSTFSLQGDPSHSFSCPQTLLLLSLPPTQL